VADEFTREALAIRVARRLPSSDVIDVLAELFLRHGTLAHTCSGQGPEFIAEAVKAWIAGVGARTAYIEKASPW
jgi:transposase InsO family protein